MYSCLGDHLTARRVFDGIPYRDVVSWNSIMKAYERAGMVAEVEGMFRSMVTEGAVAPNGVTLAVVLTACRDAGNLVLGKWVEWVRSAGMEVDSLIGSALVGMYEKCGEMEEARRVFYGISNKDVVAWNAMITGQVYEDTLLLLFFEVSHFCYCCKQMLIKDSLFGLIIYKWHIS